jgi:hypothetical protein
MIACWAAFLAVMSPTAFRVDEPNIIALARQIARNPADPYGFSINWNGTTQPAWQVLANPPLVPAWLAGWAQIFGWSEVSLHIAVIPFSLIALVAVALLAESFGASAIVIGAAAIASPAFALGSQVVMPDVAMLAAVTLAVAAALRAEQSRGAFAVACLAAFAAPLLKYNGIVAAAVLAVLALQRRTARSVVIAAMPVAALALWSFAGWKLYGTPHIVALQQLQAGGLNPLPGVIVAFGLAVLPVVAWRFDWRAAVIGVAGALVALFLLEYPAGSSVLYGVGCGVAAAFILRLRTREAVLIAWLIVPLGLQFGQRFTSVRYLIATLPPALLLGQVGLSRVRAIAAAALVVSLSIADAQTANLYRDFVRAHPAPRYSGHWGLQHYAELAGARGVEIGEQVREPMIIARHAFPPVVDDGTSWPMRISMPLRTIDCSAAANFYGNALSNCEHYPVYLPFAFSRSEVETFVITQRHP